MIYQLLRIIKVQKI